VKVHSLDLLKIEEVELLVDTGSTYTWVPKTILKKLGLRPKAVRRFKTIEGKLLNRSIGEAVISYIGEQATRMVVFAEEKDAKVLGVDALEGLGLEVDPITKQLKKTEALLAI